MIHNHLKKNENTEAFEYKGLTVYTTPDPADKGQAALIYNDREFVTAVYVDKSKEDIIAKALSAIDKMKP